MLDRIGRFLNGEARLLDERRFLDWLALYDEDATYWIPRQRSQSDALAVPSIVYEDKALLAMRVRRLLDPAMHAAQPAPRTVHVVTGLALAGDAAQPGEYRVTTMQLVLASRAGARRTYAGACEHLLRERGGGFVIAAKRIDLVDCDAVLAPMPSIL